MDDTDTKKENIFLRAFNGVSEQLRSFGNPATTVPRMICTFSVMLLEGLENNDREKTCAGLKNATDFSLRNTNRMNAVMLCATSGKLRTLEELIGLGAPLDETGGPDNITALLMAIRAEKTSDPFNAGPHEKCAYLLVDKKAGLDTPDEKTGDTPTIEAARKGMHYVVKRLIDAGTDVHARNKNDESGFIAAVIGGHWKTMHMFLNHAKPSAAELCAALDILARMYMNGEKMLESHASCARDLAKAGAWINPTHPALSVKPSGDETQKKMYDMLGDIVAQEVLALANETPEEKAQRLKGVANACHKGTDGAVTGMTQIGSTTKRKFLP